MRLRNIPGAREVIGASEYVIPEESGCAGKWKEIFGNDQPIHMEIGTGKGRFLMELAGLHPEINYVGIEKYSSVLLRAIQKMEEEPLSNVRFIRMEAEHILRYFEKEEVERIYLNFSDPWPKERHAKRRLVSREFLDRTGKKKKKAVIWNLKPTTEICLILAWNRRQWLTGRSLRSPMISTKMKK